MSCFKLNSHVLQLLLRWCSGKESACQCRRHKRCGEPHGQRSLVGYSPWGHNELDMTEHTHTHTHTYYSNHIDIICLGFPSSSFGWPLAQMTNLHIHPQTLLSSFPHFSSLHPLVFPGIFALCSNSSSSFFFFFNFLAMPHGLRNLSSPTRE